MCIAILVGFGLGWLGLLGVGLFMSGDCFLSLLGGLGFDYVGWFGVGFCWFGFWIYVVVCFGCLLVVTLIVLLLVVL